MIKRTILFVSVILFICFSCGGRGESADTEQTEKRLTKEEEKPLVALAQLWGFLKYHHPAVTSGEYDWDKELINQIPLVREAETEVQWKQILDDWVNALPAVAENKTKFKGFEKAQYKSAPNYGELFNPEYFYPQTIEKMKYVLDNGIVSSSHYVSVDSRVKHIKFHHEELYEELLYPDLSYRLLSLFRFWNAINYFFPYRDLCDQEWSTVLTDMLPLFVYAKNQSDYIDACMRLVAKVDDSHGGLTSNNLAFMEKMGLMNVPLEKRFIEGKLVVTKLLGVDAFIDENIKVGDEIVAVSGEAVEDVAKRKSPNIASSNSAAMLRNVAISILRGNEPNVVLTIKRDGNLFDLEVPRLSRKQYAELIVPTLFNPRPDKPGYRVLENNIGYVLPSSCKVEDRDEGIRKVLNGTKGVIIDLRCYPSDYISLSFLEHLGVTGNRFSLISFAYESFPGYFFIANDWNKPNNNSREQLTYKNRVVVIVNEVTQSQAEDNALGFQLIPGVTTIGSTTAGADGAVTYLNLPGGLVASFTVLGVYYPDGTDLQRVGVRVDEEIKPTIAGIKAGRDELLERAIEIIEQSMK